MDGREEQNELFGMTQAWSRYNDYIYVITNQLLSLAYAHKYFVLENFVGNNETREALREIFKYLYNEINYLQNLKNNSNSSINYIESKNNFDFEKISQILEELLKKDSKAEEVLLEESKSTFSDLCPISRNPIIQPVTQKYCNSSSTCDHTFERNNILQFLKQKNNIDCPVIGCSKKISKAFLHRDLELSYFKKNRQFNGYFDNAVANVSEMVSSALNYANKLKKNDNKGPLGQAELIDTPFQVQKKTALLHQMLLASKNAIVHTGAGVSTGSGIPDFRGPTGIWTLMDGSANNELDSKKAKKKRRKLTDSECIPNKSQTYNTANNSVVSSHNDPNCTIVRDIKHDIDPNNPTSLTLDNDSNFVTTKGETPNLELNIKEEDNNDLTVKDSADGKLKIKEEEKEEYVFYGNNKKKVVEFVLALPSEAHLSVLELLNKNFIRHIITQNIDGLHAISGVRFDRLSELHGNVFVQKCLECARRFQRAYVAPTISFNTTGELCGICTFPPFNLLSDVVLDWFDRYEKHFEDRSISQSENADLHLVLGSSLHIEPACHYASNEYHRRTESPLVIVNFQNTKLDGECDLLIHEDVNKVASLLLKKLNLSVPVFLRKSHLIILKYQLADNSCVLLLKLPTLHSFEVSLHSKTGTAFGESQNSCFQSVRDKCINKLQGLYEFTFTSSFTLKLTLFYNTQLEVEVPYERIVLFKGEIWELDICATNGSKIRISPRVFHNTSNNNNNSNNSNSNNSDNNNNNSNKDNKDNYTSNPTKDNNKDKDNGDDGKEEEGSNNLIHIRKMAISYNAHLIASKPFRMVGYLDLINRKNDKFGEFRLPNSLIALSYLWAHQCIQKVQTLKYNSKLIRNYFDQVKSHLELCFCGNISPHNYLYANAPFPLKGSKSGSSFDLESLAKDDPSEFNSLHNPSLVEDVLDHYYDEHISNTNTFSDKANCANIPSKTDRFPSCKDEHNSLDNHNSLNNQKESRYVRECKRSTAKETKEDVKEEEEEEEEGSGVNFAKRKDEIWKTIFRCSRLVEAVVYRSIRLKLVRVRRNKMAPNFAKLSPQHYLAFLSASLPLKLFLLRSLTLGELVEAVPEELVESNRLGRLKNYSRIMFKSGPNASSTASHKSDHFAHTSHSRERYQERYQERYRQKNPKTEREIEKETYRQRDRKTETQIELEKEIEKEDDPVSEEELLFERNNLNLIELLVFSVVRRSVDVGGNLEDYVTTKLFYRHLPIWIVKYLSDLFECR